MASLSTFIRRSGSLGKTVVRDANGYFSLSNASQMNIIYEFLGSEPGRDWEYDARLFLQEKDIFIEIGAHPPTIEQDLMAIFSWIRQQTPISILDEDGADSGW